MSNLPKADINFEVEGNPVTMNENFMSVSL